MELDDQLAALAAGELDADTARALRARAANDPALARRLARHERLQDLLTSWDAPPMAPDAVARLDAAVDDALAALGDAPLADRTVPGATPAPLADRTEQDTATAAATGDVVDLGAARTRREQRRAVPTWLSGTAVAAALLAVVGVGVVVGGGGLGSDDADIMADSATEESAENEMAGSTEEGATDDAMDEEATALAPVAEDVTVEDGDLLRLLDEAERLEATDGDADTSIATDTEEGDDSAADAGDEAVDGGADDSCVAAALERDTDPAVGRAVTATATGTYAGTPARFVIVRTPQDDGDRFDVLAYEAGSCELLDRDTDVR